MISPERDAFGTALLDHLEGRTVEDMLLDVDGETVPAMRAEWFFRSFAEWDWWDQQLLSSVERGHVLDLGAGAGRASLYLQERGLEVTAVEASPAAARVCIRRGVADVRVTDLNDPPADRAWAVVLLLCGNLGLGGTWNGSRRLLARLAQVVAPGAILIGDSVTSDQPEVELRMHYRDLVTPTWRQHNIPADQIPALVHDTGWAVEEHLIDGDEHAVLLRRTSTQPQAPA